MARECHRTEEYGDSAVIEVPGLQLDALKRARCWIALCGDDQQAGSSRGTFDARSLVGVSLDSACNLKQSLGGKRCWD